MTEPNNLPEPEPESRSGQEGPEGHMLDSPEPERPEVQWPDAATPTGDPLVDKALGLLGLVPATPVADHGDLYSGIHDFLLEALDAEPGLPASPKSIPRPEGDS
ncbi:hypothetical protein LN996_22095 [Arthrobacter sp. AK01]|uniref:hypothetical protein n=1 Tax=Micrococcaceae TaxID=1268 RepID=UPI001E3DAD28|nr:MULTISPECIES: hypothetical protein [Micrococcaceae]MCD4853521.1 hypothetical protein [Arthrobacter sp. AK01]MCP1413384.1 hypothetical protein [Paenarthrobacter sp. A20]